ncbi:MAG TPA: DUF6285 domain-containing protein [Acidimicrobiales bacterium]|nr:DUF6285 domain-containing protein [Acidimicrobiales bacterium]
MSDVSADGAPHDIPSAPELLRAVEEFLRGEVMAATDGRLAFHVRVAANVVAMVAREIELGPEQRLAHAEALRRLGMESDKELADAIRSGSLDDRLDEVTDVVKQTVAAKLAVANPDYVERA